MSAGDSSAGAPRATAIGERLAVVRQRIAAAGGDPRQIQVVAVSKGFGPDAVAAALEAGLVDLGENYADELLAKAAALVEPGAETAVAALPEAVSRTGVRWHFLGSVQRNKVARLAPVVACWQGVDRLSEGEAIARHAPGARVLVEVELSGIAGRGGVVPAEMPSLVDALRALELDVAGLMTVAPPGGGDPARRVFDQAARLAGQLGLSELSMGMTDDLEEAVAAGSTMVRIGRALFGTRLAPAQVPQ